MFNLTPYCQTVLDALVGDLYVQKRIKNVGTGDAYSVPSEHFVPREPKSAEITISMPYVAESSSALAGLLAQAIETDIVTGLCAAATHLDASGKIEQDIVAARHLLIQEDSKADGLRQRMGLETPEYVWTGLIDHNHADDLFRAAPFQIPAPHSEECAKRTSPKLGQVFGVDMYETTLLASDTSLFFARQAAVFSSAKLDGADVSLTDPSGITLNATARYDGDGTIADLVFTVLYSVNVRAGEYIVRISSAPPAAE